MSYQTLILLPRDSSASLNQAYECLRSGNAFHNATIAQNGDHVVVASAHWHLRIRLIAGEHVLRESQEIVQRYGASRDDRVVLASCDTRFELDSGPDPDMEHFNDYVLAVERLTDRFSGVAFERHTESFL